MPSKIRQLGDFAKQADDILSRIDNIDSTAISTIAQGAGFDSSSLLAAVDSDYLSTRQNFSFGLLSVGSNTLSSLGITNAKTSTQQDSDINASVNTLKDGAPAELDDLNKIAAAINDDANFFTTVQTYTLANAPLSVIQGSSTGFLYGGDTHQNATREYIDTFPFASETSNTTRVSIAGSPLGRRKTASSSVSPSNTAYISGGDVRSASAQPFTPSSNVYDSIIKVNTSYSQTDVGDLDEEVRAASSQQSSKNGYVTGGYGQTSSARTNKIRKISFASDGNSTEAGQLTEGKWRVSGHSTPHCGYTSGGDIGQPDPSNRIERFPFSADTYSSDIADLTGSGREQHAGNSSDTHGYVTGGEPRPDPGSGNGQTTIEKFSFASNSNATDVGDLNEALFSAMTGVNSTTHGYVAGGTPSTAPGILVQNDVQKFSFASDGNAVAFGRQTSNSRRDQTGWQT